MMYFTFKLPTIALKLNNSTVQHYCQHIINTFNSTPPTQLRELGAIWLYNKLILKMGQAKCTLKIPVEYAMILRAYCSHTDTFHELEQIALYEILKQLDKKLK